MEISNNSNIVTLEPGAFLVAPSRGLRGVTALVLQDTKLTSLSDGMLAGLPNLNNLVLKPNALRTISKSSLESLPLLQYLDLSYNKLERLEPGDAE